MPVHNGFMRIVCPSCAAEYDVPASRLTAAAEWCAARGAAANGLASEAPAPETYRAADPLEFRADPEGRAPRPHPARLCRVTAMDRLAATAPRTRAPVSLVAAWVMTFVVTGRRRQRDHHLAGAAGASLAGQQPYLRPGRTAYANTSGRHRKMTPEHRRQPRSNRHAVAQKQPYRALPPRFASYKRHLPPNMAATPRYRATVTFRWLKERPKHAFVVTK